MKKKPSLQRVNFYYFRTKALVLELLAAVCLVSGGHEIILSAFDNFKEVSLESLCPSHICNVIWTIQ